MKVLDMPPCAPILMESTRAMGYSLESAIADIIDNSIAACASHVHIRFSPYDAVPYISIVDDGCGMTAQQINDAMRYGSQSSLNERASVDLGRFGLGLKTASLSQCKRLTVITKQDGAVEARRWDLDEVYKRGTWALLALSAREIKSIPQYIEQLQPLASGTLVLWEDLDRMLNGATVIDKQMSKQMEYVREHLSLVFHRYLAGEKDINKLTISINNQEIEPKDPFLIGRSTNFQADENFNIDGHSVHVSSFMLPYVGTLTRKEKEMLGGTEGLTRDQGFYIYRNKRLLVWGTWFRMHRKDELSKLARIRVDVPNALDHLWTLDIRKSTAVPPEIIKNNLARIVERISDGSKRAWTFRGKREIGETGNHLWSKTRVRDGVIYNLNREHIFLQLLQQSLSTEQGRLLENYLRLVEENLPLNQLYVDLNQEKQINAQSEKEAEGATMDMAKEFLANIEGSPQRDILIRTVISTDPFCNYEDVVKMLKKELGEQDG